MRRHLSLWASLSLVLVSMIIVTGSIFYGITIHETYRSIKQQESHLLTATGKMLSENDQIIQSLENKETNQSLISYTKAITSAYDLDYVVVMDMQGIRYTHPNLHKIGKPFQGGDEKTVLKGKEVISTAKGSLGKSLRYLIPVKNSSGKQIGALAVGIKLRTLNEVVTLSKQKYTSAVILSLVFSLLVTSIISMRLKKQLHNLEPSEIYQLLEERNAMLDQIENAVFIINRQHHIELVNPSANQLVQQKLNLEHLKGQKIERIFPNFPSLDLHQGHEQLLKWQDEDCLITISPISVKKDLRGYLLLLRNASDAIYTMDQLVYTTTYASALQAQTHKFMNQLHVIYGLVDISYFDQLKIYLDSLLEPESEFFTRLSVLIKEPLLASFLIGEQEKFQELNVNLAFEVASDIPRNQTHNQLNNVLMIFRYLHTHVLKALKPKFVTITLSYQDDKLFSSYQINDKLIAAQDIENILQTHYFKQLLLKTHSKSTKQLVTYPLEFTVAIPYNKGE
ncbi:PAS domain-containing protein [Streptococcus pseudoporcinus]|uniref:Sensor kinase n=1 Tax=Streptococcus pseudoporcinus TaxID=361101 RepID=A0A4V6L237_9STRE|nr:sensor histidine kinase [Streptococcus pseudoporcinus]VTS14167.1 sensor kinase [Streptococcus pseudoporcinus]VUC67049.1 sensor kinase [Streptococcus pseudoporcinus]VUC97977.1 sensor kinase [Streptococcus pseudoporcinus]VUC98368.1 sensor kinase [Streptococcus pseudoporcinus]